MIAMSAKGEKPRNQMIQKMFEEADMDGKIAISHFDIYKSISTER